MYPTYSVLMPNEVACSLRNLSNWNPIFLHFYPQVNQWAYHFLNVKIAFSMYVYTVHFVLHKIICFLTDHFPMLNVTNSFHLFSIFQLEYVLHFWLTNWRLYLDLQRIIEIGCYSNFYSFPNARRFILIETFGHSCSQWRFEKMI